MCVFRAVLFLALFLTGLEFSVGKDAAARHVAHKTHLHKFSRRHRAVSDTALRFEPAPPYSKKLELNSYGKIHCKVAGGTAPNVQWFLNNKDPLPEGVTSSNGTLLMQAAPQHAGQYTCRAIDGNQTIEAKITVDVVVSPRVVEPLPNQQQHVSSGQPVYLHCRATGDPVPTTHWDRDKAILHQQHEVELEGGANVSNARIVLFNNGTLHIREAKEEDSDRYGCTAGSAAGLARNELVLVVHPEGEPLPPQESTGVAGKAVIVSISVAGAYMILVLALMVYCRRRRLKRRQRGEKMELEMAEGREKLVEDGEEEKKVGNGAPPVQNGRLLPHDRDGSGQLPLKLEHSSANTTVTDIRLSGADNSEVSAISRASKKSGQYDHLTVPRTLLTDQITLGRGEFGDVILAKIDLTQVKKLRNKDELTTETKIRPVLVKALTTKDEVQLADFRRQLELFGRVRHANVVRLIGLCNDASPHYMLLEHTDWGDLKNFLCSTRSPEETAEYAARIGNAHPLPPCARALTPLQPQHRVLLAVHLAAAANALAAKRITHRDIAARNCVITSQLHLKLSFPALTRGPDSYEYYKLHDQVVPLRWLPAEAVLEGEYSMKSDVYMFASTIWEIYTKAELPFAKLNDNSVLERLKAGSLEWSVPDTMPGKLADLLKRCWSKSPTERPQFTQISEEVNAVLQDMTTDDKSLQSQDKEDTA